MTSGFYGWAKKNKLVIDRKDYPNGVPFKAYIILVNHWCHRIILTIAQLALVIMLCTVFMNVVLRFCFNSGIAWAEEVPRLLVMLFTFLACAIGVRDHMHISVDILYNRFPKGGKMRKFMNFLANFATLICGILIFWYGLQFILRLRPGILPMTGWPTWLQYIPAPLGGFLMTFDSLLFLFHILDPDDLLYSEKEVDYQELVKQQKFTAVFAANDWMAVGLIQALRAEEMAVPDQVSVLSVDNIPLAGQFAPGLTTYSLDAEMMITEGFMLMDTAEENGGEENFRRRIILQPVLITRDTLKKREGVQQ